MYQKRSIGLKEAQGAIEAMLAEVRGHPQKYYQHAAFAVCDERGNLVAFAKMDSPNQLPGDLAVRKARTAALCGQDNHAVASALKEGGIPLEEFCAGGTSLPGGVAVFDPGEGEQSAAGSEAQPPFKLTCMGAIGVGGVGPTSEDLDVALVGLRHIQNELWPGTSR